MGRRSDFVRRPQDKYYTPYEGVLPLLPHLAPRTRFTEPCAGDGRLVDHLEKHGHQCVDAFDLTPERADIAQADALEVVVDDPHEGEVVISNPPWTRQILHPLIEHWRVQMPTWFLFDAEWMHTKQSAPFMPYCHSVISIGRLKWIEGSKSTGKDSCCWYGFGSKQTETRFFGRTE